MKSTSQKSIKKSELICIELLNSFTEAELDNFTYFINCYYFNTDKSVVKLFESLRKRILDKKSFDDIQQKLVFEQVFSASNGQSTLLKKEKKHLNAKLSLLKNLAEQFLCIEGLKEQPKEYFNILFNKLFIKKQYRLFERHANQTEKILNSKKRDLTYYEYKKMFEVYKLEYRIINGKIYNNEEDNIFELHKTLDAEYMLEKIRYYELLLMNQRITKKKYAPSFIKSIEDILSLENFTVNPLIKIGKATVDLIKFQKKTHYNILINLLSIHFNDLTKEDLIESYSAAANFCARQLREGEMDYSDIFDLYLKMDDQNVIVEDEFVPIVKIKNIIIVACRIGKFNKAQFLIEKYKPFIKKSDRENVCNFNYGIIDFYKGNYNEALKHFIRADLGQDSNLKVMILKCHYEMDTDYDERTMQIFRSAQKFFKDNKVLTLIRKKSYRNFIQILIYIYKIKNNETKMQLSRAQEKLDDQEVNSDKNWLQTKMEELGERGVRKR